MKKSLPIASIILSVVTVIGSSTIATIVHDKPWSTVNIKDLRTYGGVNNAQLANGEWWRLLTAQFVHVKPAHMLFNVIALLVVGSTVEEVVGPFGFLLLWLISGITGVYASIYSVPPPYDIGTGGSQALMGVVAAAIIVMYRRHLERWLRGTVIITLAIQLALDLTSAHHPKPGHIAGFTVGFILALGLIPRRVSDPATNS